MTPRERVYRTLNFSHPNRAPRDLWRLPGVDWFQADDVFEIFRQYPLDITPPPFIYGKGEREKGDPCRIGDYMDEWGCIWSVATEGIIGEVTLPPIKHWLDLNQFKPPYEVLTKADLSQVNQYCENSDKFILAGTNVKLFERMQALRGTQNLLMDLGYGVPEIYTLRDMLRDFFCRELEIWANTDVDGVAFSDDWGTQTSLLISPSMFRDIFKPVYAEFTSILKKAGKKVFMHSDGFIVPIFDDLIEIGIDALNSQLFCMNIEAIAQRYKGKITFWGEIDRQRILPFSTTGEVKQAVRRVRSALDDSSGGVIAQMEWGIGVPKENIAAAFEAWLK